MARGSPVNQLPKEKITMLESQNENKQQNASRGLDVVKIVHKCHFVMLLESYDREAPKPRTGLAGRLAQNP